MLLWDGLTHLLSGHQGGLAGWLSEMGVASCDHLRPHFPFPRSCAAQGWGPVIRPHEDSTLFTWDLLQLPQGSSGGCQEWEPETVDLSPARGISLPAIGGFLGRAQVWQCLRGFSCLATPLLESGESGAIPANA